MGCLVILWTSYVSSPLPKFNLIAADFVLTISVHIETFDVTLHSNVQGNDCFQLGISLYFQAFVVRYGFRYLNEFVSFETDQAIAKS